MTIKKFTAVLFLLCGGLMAACSSGHQAMHMDAGYATEVEAMPDYVKKLDKAIAEIHTNKASLEDIVDLVKKGEGITAEKVQTHFKCLRIL